MGKTWGELNEGEIGISWNAFMISIRGLDEGTLWRYGVAGDLPGKRNRINGSKLKELVEANTGRKGFCFSHKPMTEANRRHVTFANQNGFTVNLSADTLEEADQKKGLGIAPVVLAVPEDPKLWPKATPAGNRVVICPAVTHSTTCKDCKLCANKDRKVIIGFPAHGTGKRMVEKVYFELGSKVN